MLTPRGAKSGDSARGPRFAVGTGALILRRRPAVDRKALGRAGCDYFHQAGGAEEMVTLEQLIAVAVQLESGESRYFVTWGRLHDPVDTSSVRDLVFDVAPRFSLGGTAVGARVCYSLQEAALSTEAPYFYECLLSFDLHAVPTDRDTYERWRQEKIAALERGTEIAYCGDPHQRRFYEEHHGLVSDGPTPPLS